MLKCEKIYNVRIRPSLSAFLSRPYIIFIMHVLYICSIYFLIYIIHPGVRSDQIEAFDIRDFTFWFYSLYFKHNYLLSLLHYYYYCSFLKKKIGEFSNIFFVCIIARLHKIDFNLSRWDNNYR